jgi:hypothetical protein
MYRALHLMFSDLVQQSHTLVEIVKSQTYPRYKIRSILPRNLACYILSNSIGKYSSACHFTPTLYLPILLASFNCNLLAGTSILLFHSYKETYTHHHAQCPPSTLKSYIQSAHSITYHIPLSTLLTAPVI